MAKKEESKSYYKLIEADIVEGIPCCPICHKIVNGGLDDYRQVEHNGETFTEFIKFCATEGCFTRVRYQAKITLEGTTRYSFHKTEEIKEEELEGGDLNDISLQDW